MNGVIVNGGKNKHAQQMIGRIIIVASICALGLCFDGWIDW